MIKDPTPGMQVWYAEYADPDQPWPWRFRWPWRFSSAELIELESADEWKAFYMTFPEPGDAVEPKKEVVVLKVNNMFDSLSAAEAYYTNEFRLFIRGNTARHLTYLLNQRDKWKEYRASKYKAGDTVYYMNDDRVAELLVLGPDEGMGDGWYALEDKVYHSKFSGHFDDLFRTPKAAIEHEVEMERNLFYSNSKSLLDKWDSIHSKE